MQIGQLASSTGTPTKTIRYYESIGLMPQPDRSPNGYRRYGDDAVEALRFIRDAKAAGLALREIASIIELRGKGESTCDHVIGMLEAHMRDVDARIAGLQETKRALARLTAEAKQLDPAECTDPVRCQTISPS